MLTLADLSHVGPASLEWSVGSNFMEAKFKELDSTSSIIHSGFACWMSSNNIL